MVGRWGMSNAIGPVAVIPSEAEAPLLPGAAGTSELTQEKVDEEVRRLVDEAYAAVTQLLTENRDKPRLAERRAARARDARRGRRLQAAGVEPAVEPEAPERPPEVVVPGIEASAT